MKFTTILILLFTQSISFASEPTLKPNNIYTGDLSQLEEKGIIRVLVASDIGLYYVDEGQPRGVTAELTNHFRNHVKSKGLHLHIHAIPVSREMLIPSLLSGQGDIIAANFSVTESRKEYLDFTAPLITDVNEYVVTSKAHSAINSAEDLSGKEIWIRQSSSYTSSLRRINQSLVRNDLAPATIIFADENLQDYDLVSKVNTGEIQMTVLDEHKAATWVNQGKGINVHTNLPLREGSNIAWATRKNSPELISLINSFVETAKEGTLLGNILKQRYLTNPYQIDQALKDESIINLSDFSNHYELYGNLYDFDPLLLKAVSYQESGFDQSKTSHRGAVGLMQVMPSTATDKNVGVPNIQSPKGNIHAGTKYLRFIKDRYFKRDYISKENQLHLALAAYNAGPAKINRVRKKAEKEGFNPNVWFGNVELFAMKHISSEPVKYVSNIQSYYVIYKQLKKIEESRDDAKRELKSDQKLAILPHH